MKTRIVFKANIARELLKEGYKIVDLKPQKQIDGSINFNRTTFVFEDVDGLEDAIKRLTINK